MAIGDKAAAKGLAVYASTQAHSLGYENDNKRGDELADEITRAQAAEAALSTGKFDKSKIIISTSTPTVVTGGVWLKPV